MTETKEYTTDSVLKMGPRAAALELNDLASDRDSADRVLNQTREALRRLLTGFCASSGYSFRPRRGRTSLSTPMPS